MFMLKRVIKPVPPFDFALTLGVYASFRDQKVDIYDGSSFSRLLASDGSNYLVTARPAGTVDQPEVRVWITPPPATDQVNRELIEKLQWMMGADVDLAPFYQLVENRDPVLLSVVRNLRGLKPPRTPSMFEALIIAITEQQIALAVSSRLRGKLVMRYGEGMPIQGRSYYQFPTSDRLAGAQPEDIRELGFSSRKAACIVEVARRVRSGDIALKALRGLPLEVALRDLTQIKGIGRWTVEYMMCRGMGRYDVLPANDAGLRAAVSKFYHHGTRVAEADIRAILEPLGELKGFAAFYLIFAYAFERYGLDPRSHGGQLNLL